MVAACDGPAPPPEAVALIVIEPVSTSACVVVYETVQVTVVSGVSVVAAGPQLNGVLPNRLSVTVNWAGPSVVFPLFLITNVKVIGCPAWLYV
jgi:hypothetical protein